MRSTNLPRPTLWDHGKRPLNRTSHRRRQSDSRSAVGQRREGTESPFRTISRLLHSNHRQLCFVFYPLTTIIAQFEPNDRFVDAARILVLLRGFNPHSPTLRLSSITGLRRPKTDVVGIRDCRLDPVVSGSLAADRKRAGRWQNPRSARCGHPGNRETFRSPVGLIATHRIVNKLLHRRPIIKG